LETGLAVVRANNSQLWERERSAGNWALETLLKRASKPNKKITRSLWTSKGTVFLNNVFERKQRRAYFGLFELSADDSIATAGNINQGKT
jgi:hypothetical protein